LHKFDIIICGAGGAGLSFAYHLSKSSLSNKKILLLDKDSKQNNDRTWCYWSKEQPEFDCAKEISWDSMSFEGKHFEKNQSILPYHYYHIKGLDFYEEIRNHLSAFPNIVFRQESVCEITDLGNLVEVSTEKEKYQTDWIFNSIPQFSKAFPLKEKSVKQYFKGFFIKTTNPCFNAEHFKLMDFSCSDESEVKFFYVLPYSSTEALVECTVLASNLQNPENYCNDIRTYIQRQLNIEAFTIVEQEKGMIPMSVLDMPYKSSKRVFNIGTVGGMTKASTGYTFNNIQIASKNFLNSWQTNFNKPPKDFQNSSSRFKFYDHLLLYIIQTQPKKFQHIMEVLFKRNDFKQVLKFLDEDTNVLEESLLFLKLPWKPFFKALYEKNLSRSVANRPNADWRGIFLGNTSHPLP
jgi:lycopene beta-cyclase